MIVHSTQRRAKMNKVRLLKLSVLAIVVLPAVLVAAGVPWRSLAAQLGQGPVGPRDPGKLAAPGLTVAPVPGGPRFLMVNASQFRSAFPERGWEFNNGELDNPGPGDNFYEAALTLPDNVKIIRVVVYFYDNSEQDLVAGLWRSDPTTGNWTALAELASSGAQDAYRHVIDTSIVEPLVDQQRYSYVMEVGMPPAFNTLRLAAVRIDYISRGDQGRIQDTP
jgi:hypothetical protein